MLYLGVSLRFPLISIETLLASHLLAASCPPWAHAGRDVVAILNLCASKQILVGFGGMEVEVWTHCTFLSLVPHPCSLPVSLVCLSPPLECTEPLSVESTACSLGSMSESGQGYECSTPSETNCSFDPQEEPSSGTPSAPCPRHPAASAEPRLFPLPPAAPAQAEKQEPLQSSGGTLSMDFPLPADINEALPLIAGPVDLDREPEVAPAQVSLSVTEFGLIGIGDVNSFLSAHQACPAPVARSEPLSQ